MGELYSKFCNLLNINLDTIDDRYKRIMESGFHVMFIHYDKIKLNQTLESFSEELLELFQRDGGETNILDAYRFSLNGIRHYHKKLIN